MIYFDSSGQDTTDSRNGLSAKGRKKSHAGSEETDFVCTEKIIQIQSAPAFHRKFL